MHPLESDGLSVLPRLLAVCVRLALVLMGVMMLVPQVVVVGPINESLLSLQCQRSHGF